MRAEGRGRAVAWRLAAAAVPAAWAIFAAWSLVRLGDAWLGHARGGHEELHFGLAFVTCVLALDVWFVVLLFVARAPNTPQWSVLLVLSIVFAAGGWLVHDGLFPARVTLWMAPATYTTLLRSGGLLLVYLAVASYLVVRRRPAPLHERYTLGPFPGAAGDDVFGQTPLTRHTAEQPVTFEDRERGLTSRGGEYLGPDDLAP